VVRALSSHVARSHLSQTRDVNVYTLALYIVGRREKTQAITQLLLLLLLLLAAFNWIAAAFSESISAGTRRFEWNDLRAPENMASRVRCEKLRFLEHWRTWVLYRSPL